MGQLSNLFTDEEEALLIRNMRKRLLELAKNLQPMGYQEFCNEFHLDWDMHVFEDRKLIGKFLGKISEDEFSEGRPLLSVFIKHENGLPGNGFFTMAEQLGRFMPIFMDKQKFVDKERQYAYEYWNKHKI